MEHNNQILVAEDEEDLRTILSEQLSNEGYDVSVAGDGREALCLLKEKKYIVVLLDLKMPVLNGFHVLRFIKKNLPDTKVIIVTSYGDLINVKYCRDLGADDIIEKPYKLGELFYSIHTIVDNSHITN